MRRATLAWIVLALGCDGGDPGDQRPDEADGGPPSVFAEPICPPPEPHGYGLDDYAADIAWTDCDGAPVSLHDLCGEGVGLVFNFYGWCTSCYRYMEAANGLQEAYGPRGLRTIIVVSEDLVEAPVTAEYCAQIRDRYAPAATVVFDPDQGVEAYGEADLTLIIDRYGRVVFKRIGATVDAIERGLEAALGE